LLARRCLFNRHGMGAFNSVGVHGWQRYPRRVDLRTVRYSERPEFWDQPGDLFRGMWPEYNVHGDVVATQWDPLFEDFPQYQFALLGPDGQVMARGHSIPVAWDGTDAGLGPGIDAAITGGFALRSAAGKPTALSAISAEVPIRHRKLGLASAVLRCPRLRRRRALRT
jgi:hypothetical protein